jgi:hypothetical protein
LKGCTKSRSRGWRRIIASNERAHGKVESDVDVGDGVGGGDNFMVESRVATGWWHILLVAARNRQATTPTRDPTVAGSASA